jgi:LuxR family maltose regulon positive regulatory protein
MATPLLTTKLYIPPPLPNLVERPRLVKRLDEGLRLGNRLTLVSAPAGFGKTTLVSEWVQAMGAATPPIAVAWLSLDEGDNDPTRFLAYLVAALQTIAANIGEGALGMLQSPQPPTEAILTSLLNEIAAIPDRLVLVLDDYHLIETQSIQDALAFLLEHLPPPERGLHLVIATRDDPHLPLARLRGRGRLTELRGADLRFTSSEAAEFLNQVMALDLSAEDISALETRTEGWIVGLQLAAISMRGHKDASSLIQSFTGSQRYVLDYLVEEVLEQQSESVQTFLLQTSILNRLTGSLCDAVCSVGTATGQDNGQTTLEILENANLFIVPLDGERRWYRYHHLFADLLRNQLKASQPDFVPALHRQASAWYAANDLRPEAIAHSLAAEDWERVAQLIDEVVNDVMGGGAYLTDVLGWLDTLPQEVVRARPRLGIVRAWMLMLMRHNDDAERCLHELEETTDSLLPKEDQLQVTAIRAFLARQQDEVPKAIELSHQVLDALAEGVTTLVL